MLVNITSTRYRLLFHSGKVEIPIAAIYYIIQSTEPACRLHNEMTILKKNVDGHLNLGSVPRDLKLNYLKADRNLPTQNHNVSLIENSQTNIKRQALVFRFRN